MSELKTGIYLHFKTSPKDALEGPNGHLGLYELIDKGLRYSENEGELVIYKALYSTSKYPLGQKWARPQEMFAGTKNVNGVDIPRFKFIAPSLKEAIKILKAQK